MHKSIFTFKWKCYITERNEIGLYNFDSFPLFWAKATRCLCCTCQCKNSNYSFLSVWITIFTYTTFSINYCLALTAWSIEKKCRMFSINHYLEYGLISIPRRRKKAVPCKRNHISSFTFYYHRKKKKMWL